jgi:hypothetical protein
MNIDHFTPGNDTWSCNPINQSQMRRVQKTPWRALLPALIGTAVYASAQDFTVGWSSLDGGGGPSAAGAYAVSGTIGQSDAGKLTGGNFILEGGLWSGIHQSTLPPLKLKKRSGHLVLSWPADAPGVQLQSATQLSLDGAGWLNFEANPVRVGDELELIIEPALTPPNPIRFFRLHQP